MFYLEKFFFIDCNQKIDFDYIKKIKGVLIIKNSKKTRFERYSAIKKECKSRRIQLFVANDLKLLFRLRLKNFYISSFNKNYYLNLPKNIRIIGSAHNIKEIREKINQGCKKVVLSRLFKTYKKGYLGVLKFNLMSKDFNNIIALGGIKGSNLKSVKMTRVVGIAMRSELRNKPFA